MGKYESDAAMSRQAYRDGMITKKQMNADLARYAREQEFRRQNRKTGPTSAAKPGKSVKKSGKSRSGKPAVKKKIGTKKKGEKHSTSFWRKKYFGLKKRK